MIRTPDQRLRVFVSSTLEELATERVVARRAIEQLRLVPVMFELGASPHPPRDLYRAYLEQSHIFVGLYWQRYGWVAPDMDISGLEDEWVLSEPHPRLVYLKQAESGREPRLDHLIGRIRDSGISYRPFGEPDELFELLQTDLAVLLSERFDPQEPPPDRSVVVNQRAARVPGAPSSIIGREADLLAVRDLLQRDDTRLVTVTGAGGSGKTRLAIELAHAVQDEGAVPVVFVDLSGLRDPSLVLPTIAAALGVKAPADELVDALASVMVDRSALIVIDNFEHVIEAASAVADILAATDSVRILVTSRQPLHLRWEQEYPLAPLEVPDPEHQRSSAAVSASPAVELLIERTRRLRPQFDIDDTNAQVLAELARRLDGLPLALELAAARLRVLQPADLLARLGSTLDALSDSSPDKPGRHQTLRAAIAWSHEQLTEAEQAVFRRLGVFAGGAVLDAIEAVCGDEDLDGQPVLDVIASLVDKSLVTPVHVPRSDLPTGGSRFTLLTTIREYAIEQLVAAGEAEKAWDRHLEWHASLAEAAWTGFWSDQMEQWLQTVEQERDNLRSALDHAAGAGSYQLGLRAGGCLWPFWDVRGEYSEGERRLADLLARAADDDTIERGRALHARGWLVALMGDFAQGRELMREGLPLVRRHGTAAQLSWSLAEQGNVAFSLGDEAGSDELFTEALALAAEVGDPFLRGLGHFGLSYVALLRGDLGEMRRQLDTCLELVRWMYQPWGIAWAQFTAGVLAIIEGDPPAAMAPLTESLEMRWAIHDARGLTESIQLLATVASAVGEVEWSAILHGAAELQREANGLTILPFLRPLHDESVDRLRAHLVDDELTRCWQLGRGMPLEKLVAEALARRDVAL